MAAYKAAIFCLCSMSKISEECKIRITQLRIEGWSINSIAQQTGVSTKTIARLIKNIEKPDALNKKSVCGFVHYEDRTIPVANELYKDYRRKARERGYSFEITREKFRILIIRDCHYCGTPPCKLRRRKVKRGEEGVLSYNGIDRKDNQKGYNNKNCVTCCFVCNRAKRDMSYKEFVQWIRRIKNVKSTVCD